MKTSMHKLIRIHKLVFEHRFQNGYDGVLRKLSLIYASHPQESQVEVIVSVKDSQEGWLNLRLKVIGLKRFIFQEGPSSYQVLSNGFTFDWYENELYMSFNLDPIEAHTQADYIASQFFFVGTEGFWETLPYDEYPTPALLIRQTQITSPVRKPKDLSAFEGVAIAKVIECGATREGFPEWADSDMAMCFWVYEYEYPVPGTNEMKKHQDTVKFEASIWGSWFTRYPEGFTFLVRYNLQDPTYHMRTTNFD